MGRLYNDTMTVYHDRYIQPMETQEGRDCRETLTQSFSGTVIFYSLRELPLVDSTVILYSLRELPLVDPTVILYSLRELPLVDPTVILYSLRELP